MQLVFEYMVSKDEIEIGIIFKILYLFKRIMYVPVSMIKLFWQNIVEQGFLYYALNRFLDQ